MSKKLVLAEKPSVARDMAKVLGCHKKGNGFFEGNNYIVTWGLGHLVTLADPEQYGDQYKTWRLDHLPMLFSPMKLVVIKQTSKQFHSVKTQLHRQDVQEIIIATDAGREGELVARWIIEKARVKKPLKRLWISSVTDKAIKDGFQSLKSGKAYDNLYQSAVARAEADWIVGINATRALTCRYNAQLSCGRVQTPTIALIAEREEQIKSFKPKAYYGITIHTKDGYKLMWQEKKERRIFDAKRAERIIDDVERTKEGLHVSEIDKVEKKSFAPQLYDLTELQRDAYKRFGFSAKETLAIMQRLYEQHKLLTYPRTDSRFLSSDIVSTIKDRLMGCAFGPYSKLANKALQFPIQAKASFVNNEKVSDHHAIIPTEQRLQLHQLNDKERKIYDLVVKRFLAVLYPAYKYEQTTIKAKMDKHQFVARGERVISPGWKEVYDVHLEEEDEDIDAFDSQQLPELQQGESISIQRIEKTEGKTKPPAPFNEATLLSAMENPAKYVQGLDKSLANTLGHTGGLGTVATRADIIDKLFGNFLIEKKGKDIYATSKGKQLLTLVPEELKSPALTAEWEQKLDAISKGKLSQHAFIDEMKSYTKKIVQDIKNDNKKFVHDNLSGKDCPECGKQLLEVNGKKGKMLVCQDRSCGHRKTISRLSNARCPNCRKKLELHGEGEGQIFVCTCGHREKLSSFQERKNKEKSKASKRDVNQYLKKQSKETEEPFNPALAEALKKLKLK